MTRQVGTASTRGDRERGRGVACRRQGPRPSALAGFWPCRTELQGGWPRLRPEWCEARGSSSRARPRRLPTCTFGPPIGIGSRPGHVHERGSRQSPCQVWTRASWPNPWRAVFFRCRPAQGSPRPRWAGPHVGFAGSPNRRPCASAKARPRAAPPAGETTGPAMRVLRALGATRTRSKRPRGTALESVPSAAWTRP